MAVYSILPTTNILMADIRDTLNNHGGSVTNELITFFKASANINWASKHKPVRLGADFCQDFDTSKPNYRSGWWKSTDGNCGLTPRQVTSFNNLMEVLDGTDPMNGWTYNLPTGGSTFPYRLGDYAGYSAVARPMSYDFTCPDKVENKSSSKLDAICYFNRLNDNSLSWGDFTDLKNYHFGIYVKQKNGKQVRRVIVNETIGDGGFLAEINTSGMPTGTWRVYPFIAENPLGQSDPDAINTLYTMPMCKPKDIKIVSSFVTIVLESTKNELGSINYKLSVINPLSQDVKFASNNIIRCRYSYKDWLDPLVIGEQEVKLSDNLVAKANSTTVLASGYFLNISTEVANDPKVWYLLDTGKYIGSIIPSMPKV